MSCFRNPIDKFISELGGTVEVATLAGVAPSVVSSWRIKGRIPGWRLAAVLVRAGERGVSFPGNAPTKRQAAA